MWFRLVRHLGGAILFHCVTALRVMRAAALLVFMIVLCGLKYALRWCHMVQLNIIVALVRRVRVCWVSGSCVRAVHVRPYSGGV